MDFRCYARMWTVGDAFGNTNGNGRNGSCGRSVCRRFPFAEKCVREGVQNVAVLLESRLQIEEEMESKRSGDCKTRLRFETHRCGRVPPVLQVHVRQKLEDMYLKDWRYSTASMSLKS